MSLYADVMPSVQRRVLKRLGPLTAEHGFYLGGGTAIAIQLRHRRSIDFDWFTDMRIPNPLDLAEKFRGEGLEFEVGSIEPGTLHGKTESVLVSFLEYRYPLLNAPVAWAEYGCRLASLEDLACMKLSAISSRGAKKDFIDIHALGQAGHTLSEMLSLYQRKFHTPDIGHVLYSLTYFDDAEADEMPEMISGVSWEEVKSGIERSVLAFEE